MIPSPTMILGILLALSVAALGVMSKLYIGSKEALAAEHQKLVSFTAQVKVLGEEQEKKTHELIVLAQKDKEKSDAENVKAKSDLAGLYSAYRSLRDQSSRAHLSLLPSPAPGAANPETITFERTGLDNALSGLDKGVTGLLEEGDKAIVDLDTARSWAQQR